MPANNHDLLVEAVDLTEKRLLVRRPDGKRFTVDVPNRAWFLADGTVAPYAHIAATCAFSYDGRRYDVVLANAMGPEVRSA